MKPILPLQFLRALAAVAVVLFHFQFDLGRYLGLAHTLPDLSVGAAGVDLFFVISGFVMVYASEPYFAQPSGPREFFMRRLIRIVPFYWLVTMLYLAIALAMPSFGRSYTPGVIATSFAFVPYPRPDGVMQPVIGQGWSLNYEMFFYVIFAIGLIATRNIAVTAISALFFLMVLVGQWLAPLPPIPTFILDPIILEFVFGMILALAYRKGLRLPRPVAWAVIAGGLSILALIALPTPLQRPLFWGLPAALIAAGAVLGRFEPRSHLWAPLALAGDASYAIYLLHSIPVRAVVLFAGWAGLNVAAAPWLYLVIAVVATVLLANLTYILVERPLTTALRNSWLSRSSPSKA